MMPVILKRTCTTVDSLKKMKATTDAPIKTLHHLMEDDVRRFVSGENELSLALERWTKLAGSVKLKNNLIKYHDQVKHHIEELDRFLEEEDLQYLFSNDDVMHSLVQNTDRKLSECGDASVKDAALLACIQNINHFKIGSYGTAAAFANTLGRSKTAQLFHDFEVNEKQTDDRLSQLAEHEINQSALTNVKLENK
jgi:ferritin-like metal-binding protein YciE